MTAAPDEDSKYCEACGGNIPVNAPHYTALDYSLCEAHALTYQNMIDTPGCFINNNNEEMSADQANEHVREHLKIGGKLSDKVLNFGITLQ